MTGTVWTASAQDAKIGNRATVKLEGEVGKQVALALGNLATAHNVVGGITDDKIVAAIRSGNAPDIASSFNSYNVGNYCGTGGWIDLSPLMAKDHINASIFPPAPHRPR